MPKYLLEACYTSEGLQGLIRDKATGRHEAVNRAVEAMGGKIEALYFCFGEHDVVLIVELADNISAAAIGVRVSSSGLVRTKITPLLTIDEVDQAIGKGVEYRAPGA
jgi:uncharacterized protein with GYD domain